MTFRYENSVGQVIESETKLENLEGVARWVRTEVDGTAKSAVVTQAALPDGEPTEKWTIDQLKAYAEAKSIDLSGATLKPEILAKVNAPLSPTGTADTKLPQPAPDASIEQWVEWALAPNGGAVTLDQIQGMTVAQMVEKFNPTPAA